MTTSAALNPDRWFNSGNVNSPVRLAPSSDPPHVPLRHRASHSSATYRLLTPSMHPNVAPTSVPPLDSASRSMRLSHRGSNKLSRRTSPAPSGFRSVKHGVPLGPSARSAAAAVNSAFAVKPYDTRARSPRRMPCTHAEARAALVDNTSSRSSSNTSALRPVATNAAHVNNASRASETDTWMPPPKPPACVGTPPPDVKSCTNARVPSARRPSGPTSGESFPRSSASAAVKLTVRASSRMPAAAVSGTEDSGRVSPREPKARATYPSDRASLERSSGSSVMRARSSSGSDRALASPRTTSAPMASAADAPATKSAP